MNKSALIIIDAQFGMYNGEKISPIFQGEEKIEKIHGLVKKARIKKIPIIYVKHQGGKNHPLEVNTNGYKIHPKVKPLKDDIIIEKKTPDSFLNTELLDVLRNASITNLYIVGNQTDFCIDTTCKSAFSKGLKVILIKDCHSTWDSDSLSASQIIEHHNKVLGGWFSSLQNSNEITFSEFEKYKSNDEK